MKFIAAFLAIALLQTVVVSGDDDVIPSYKTACIELNGTISLNVTYTVADGTAEHYLVTVAENANVTGECAANTSSLVLSDDGGVVTMLFEINNSGAKLDDIDINNWGVTEVTYDYSVVHADAKQTGVRQAKADGSFFNTPINRTYSCSKEAVSLVNVTAEVGNDTVLQVGESVVLNNADVVITVGPVTPSTDYDYHYCKADQKVKDIVPIAVGVALAALVVIVLVAYLIGRRRTVAAGGYERV